MKKLFVVLTILFTGLIGCTKKEKVSTEKVLNIPIIQEVKGLDPIYANDRYSSNETARVYEGLLQYHYLKRPYTLEPNLAEAMPTVSKDGLIYTFKIKKGVMFHDDKAFPNGKGRELVAQDFVYSIKRLADPKLQGLGWWLLDGKVAGLNEWRDKYAKMDKVNYDEEVEGMKALDKYTLQFKLVRPFPQFLYSLAMTFTSAVAREVVEHYGEEFINHPVGTGPFMLPEFKQTKKIVYTKNPNYRDKFYPSEASESFKEKGYLVDAGKKIPFVDKVVVHIMVEAQPRWLNFKKGKVDYIEIPKDNFDSAISPSNEVTEEFKKYGVELQVIPSLDVTYIAFNHDLKLFKDNVKLRRAMALAYDVNGSNKLFYFGKALPAQSVVPPGIAGNIPGYKSPYREQNIELAKKLLAEAGYPGGKGLPTITYDTAAGTVARQGGEYFKQQMEKIGINISVQTNPWPEFNKKITKRDIMVYGIAWGADYPDAENFLQLLYGPNRAPGANGSGYDNPEFNQLFDAAKVMQDSPERTALYEKMVRIAAEQVPWIYGVHRQKFVLKHQWLKNYYWSDFDNGHAAYINIDMAEQKKLREKL